MITGFIGSRSADCSIFADPFEDLDLPVFIEEALSHRVARCVAFNHWGTFLAGMPLTSCVCLLVHTFFQLHLPAFVHAAAVQAMACIFKC